MNRLQKLSLATLALAAPILFSACESLRAKPGPDGTAFSLATLDGTIHGSPKQVVEAAESVLRDMDLHVVSSAASGVDGKLVARSALDKPIHIEVRKVDDATSKLAIRIGTFGDAELSREIYRKTKAKR